MCRALETIAALDITGALAPLFASQDKRFTAEIQYNIERYGNEESLRQLISILMDNAVKYMPEGRDIHFSLKKAAAASSLHLKTAVFPWKARKKALSCTPIPLKIQIFVAQRHYWILNLISCCVIHIRFYLRR